MSSREGLGLETKSLLCQYVLELFSCTHLNKQTLKLGCRHHTLPLYRDGKTTLYIRIVNLFDNDIVLILIP